MNQVVIDNRKKIAAAVTSCFRTLDTSAAMSRQLRAVMGLSTGD